MPRSRSSGSERIFSADRDGVTRSVEELARRLVAREAGVVAVIWFGSWVNGTPRPRSDVDLCILLEASSLSRRERIARYLPGAFPVGIDLFVYTLAELARLSSESPDWYRIIRSGRVVAGELPSPPVDPGAEA